MVILNLKFSSVKAVVPQPFWHLGPISRKTIVPRTGGRKPGAGWFRDDSSTLHFACTLYLLLFHQLHPRSSGIRSWTLGAPVLENHIKESPSEIICLRFAVK